MAKDAAAQSVNTESAAATLESNADEEHPFNKTTDSCSLAVSEKLVVVNAPKQRLQTSPGVQETPQSREETWAVRRQELGSLVKLVRALKRALNDERNVCMQGT